MVGTKKGAFILTADGKRENWEVSGPHFAGWEMYHLKGSPVDPNRIYASQTSGWFGQMIQRSDDGGKTWARRSATEIPECRASIRLPGHRTSGTTARSTRGNSSASGISNPRSPIRTRFTPARKTRRFSNTVDGGKTWQELPGLRSAKGHLWQPGAGGMAFTPSFSIRTTRSGSIVAISAAGAFRTDDGGKTWKPINRGLKSPYELPDPDAEVGHCVHRIAMHPSRPGRPVHAKALGRDAHRQRRRDVARSQRQSADRLRIPDRRARARTGNDLRRARSRATPSIFRRTESCASIAAGRAATNGKRSRKVCRRRIAT